MGEGGERLRADGRCRHIGPGSESYKPRVFSVHQEATGSLSVSQTITVTGASLHAEEVGFCLHMLCPLSGRLILTRFVLLC